MKLRCELHLGSLTSKVVLVPKSEEKLDHLALKLAAYTMFLPQNPIVEPSSDHPSLLSCDIRPDLMALNISGEIDLWIECGFVSMRKLDKVTRRFPKARKIILKTSEREALRLRTDAKEQVKHHERLEIWCWPGEEFKTWLRAMEEKVEIFGEAHEKFLNLVVNQTAIAVDLQAV